MNPELQDAGFSIQVATPPLSSLIKKEIDGAAEAISFRRFMELALYHPEHGYYASGKSRIGREGDFFTSVSLGNIYGRLLGSVCREVWETLGRPSPFTIVEQGANDGSMAADILGAVHDGDKDFGRAVRFMIVEPFPMNQQLQQYKLKDFTNVIWVPSLEEIADFTGIHLSNELLDAFPVDSLRWNGSSWEEEVVECRNGQLDWGTRPIHDPELQSALASLPTNLSKGYRLEINRGIRPWLSTLHTRLQRGIILTVDYGQAGGDRYAPHRADGTLLAYKKHERFNDPLPFPGERDITAQVDFTAVSELAQDVGFEILGYSDQHHFLVGIAEPWLRSLGDFSEKSDAAKSELRALQALLNPGSMGIQFKAIAFGKDFPKETPLSCFKYQRPGVRMLTN
jgi:SAM-dependent MidA family methyltransferase